MHIAIHSHPDHEHHHHLPHQAIWFVLMLTLMLMLLSTLVAANGLLFG
jgi:hypothetical protein